MFKIKNMKYINEMGFIRNGDDYIIRKMIEGNPRILFTIYAGSSYIRQSRSSYTSTEQLRLIYEWTKADYIEWEN